MKTVHFILLSTFILIIHAIYADDCVWSPWLDRDDPTGNCDCEHTSFLYKEGYPGTCENPLKVEARRKSDQTPAEDLADVFNYQTYGERGFDCWNVDQEHGRRCDDFELRMCCPVQQGLIFSKLSFNF